VRVFADLHLHTHFSDGAHSPEEVVRLARDQGLEALAICDHDTVAALAAAEREARKCGLRLIPGVEVSVAWQGEDIHLLGYFVDRRNPGLLRLLAGLRRARRGRIARMVRLLQQLGFPLEFSQVVARAPQGRPVGRPHLAETLAAAGWVETYNDAFRFYIGRGCPAYLPNRTASPEETIRVLLGAGGVPVLAHPAVYGAAGVIERFAQAGIMGLEVDHPRQAPEETGQLHAAAARLGLLETGGSDYHGGGRGDAPPGSSGVDRDQLRRLEEARDRVPGILRRMDGRG
jgi:3',5'-nucleoside bisphosphate phosphatase